MKLLAMAVCIACIPAFAQEQSRISEALQRLQWGAQRLNIVQAIDAGRSFQLPDNSLSSTVMATGIKLDDGRYSTFTMTGIEITADGLKVTADELIYHWDSYQIELRGNVQLKPVSPPQ